jgi:glutathione reductase (NADPH)
MVLASRFAQGFDDARGFGWSLPVAPVFDWAALKRQVDAEVARLEGVYRANLERAGVAIHDERAVLDDAHTVRLVRSGERVRARHVLLATGALPEGGPAIPGGDLAASSNDVFQWPAQPRRVVVQGAGYIALEFACLLNRLGSEVTVVLRANRVLRGFDEEVREHLQSQLAGQGIRFATGSSLRSIERRGHALVATLTSGEAIEADALLRALGRRPNTVGLGLEAAGVELDPRGAVKVSIDGRTNVPHIHAVGDVTDRVQLTPAAIREGQAYADRVFGGVEATRLSHLGEDGLVPSAVFTTPEVGAVGLTEAEALARHADLDIYRTTFKPMKATLSGGDERTLMKLVVDRATDHVLGCHLVGAEAAEMIQLVGIALTLSARKADFDATLAVHPTAAEELVTMRVPARRHGTA